MFSFPSILRHFAWGPVGLASQGSPGEPAWLDYRGYTRMKKEVGFTATSLWTLADHSLAGSGAYTESPARWLSSSAELSQWSHVAKDHGWQFCSLCPSAMCCPSCGQSPTADLMSIASGPAQASSPSLMLGPSQSPSCKSIWAESQDSRPTQL